MWVYIYYKKRWKIVESSFISNHDTYYKTDSWFSYFVSLLGQIGSEKLQNPLFEMIWFHCW